MSGIILPIRKGLVWREPRPPKPSSDLVQKARHILALAESGEMQALAFATVDWRAQDAHTDDAETYTSGFHVEGYRWSRLLAGVTVVHARITKELMGSYEVFPDLPPEDKPA